MQMQKQITRGWRWRRLQGPGHCSEHAHAQQRISKEHWGVPPEHKLCCCPGLYRAGRGGTKSGTPKLLAAQSVSGSCPAVPPIPKKRYLYGEFWWLVLLRRCGARAFCSYMGLSSQKRYKRYIGTNLVFARGLGVPLRPVCTGQAGRSRVPILW